MPQMGESVNEGTVSIWHKKVGDAIKKDDVLFEVETDKASIEVPAPADGVISAINGNEGDTLDVGAVVCVIAVEGEKAPAAAAPTAAAPASSGMDVIMPQMGESVNEGTVAAWHKKVGDAVKKNDILFDVETDKAAIEVPAPADGVIAVINGNEGDTLEVGDVVCVIAVEGGAAPAAPAAKAAPAPAAAPAAAPAPAASSAAPAKAGNALKAQPAAKLSPAVRRLVAEHDLDIAAVTGTGKGGRITRQDVIAFIDGGGASAPAAAAPVAPAPTAAAPAASSAPTPAADSRSFIPFDKIRKMTGDHMVMSKATSPHVLQTVEVDYHAVDAVRKKLSPQWKADKGYSLTYLPFISRAITMAIKDFPRVNSSVVGDGIQIHSLVNLGIAVDLNFEGLVVPVIKDCANKSVGQIAEGIKTLATKAKARKLTPDDMSGATYTLSNSGPFGTMMTASIISQPQVAIMSTDGIKKRPVVIESEYGDTIGIRPVGILAQSFDHRAFDGAYSAAFLNHVRQIIEQTDWASEI